MSIDPEVLPPLPPSRCSSCRPLQAEVARLQAQLKQSEAKGRRLEKKLATQEAANANLAELLAEARRAGKRQSRPFSKGKLKKNPKKPGRRSGDDHGRHGHRQPPEQVDETIDVPPPDQCPFCGAEVEAEDHIDSQYQADIPEVRPHVTQFNCRRGRCKRCRRPVFGRHPRQNSTARGAAASHVGPRAMALAVQFHTGLGLSFGKVVALFQMCFGLQISRGALAQIQDRTALRLAPTYHAMVEAVERAPVVVPDETGWHVGGRSAWLWVFVTELFTIYLIAPGRSFEDACEVLPADYAGMITRDGWGVYRGYKLAIHQTCDHHLLARCDELLLTAQRGEARVPRAVQRLIWDGLELRRQRDEGEISEHGLRVAIGKLEARTERLLAWNPRHEENRKLLKHLRNEHGLGALFAFLHHPGLPATNHWAEQEVRPAVVTRKVWGGNRTWRGASAQEVNASVLRTGQRQGRDAPTLIVPILCAPGPLLADLHGLGPPPLELETGPPPGTLEGKTWLVRRSRDRG